HAMGGCGDRLFPGADQSAGAHLGVRRRGLPGGGPAADRRDRLRRLGRLRDLALAAREARPRRRASALKVRENQAKGFFSPSQWRLISGSWAKEKTSVSGMAPNSLK